MAHYALLDENNIVVQVITGIDEDNVDNLPSNFSSWEEFYGDFHNKTCKRTSYNTYKNNHLNNGEPFRGTYAGIGMLYEVDNDRFIPIKPFDSWIWDENSYSWIPPIPIIDNDNSIWNEDLYQNDTNNPKTLGWEIVE